jgi:signal transduction histidine kinase
MTPEQRIGQLTRELEAERERIYAKYDAELAADSRRAVLIIASIVVVTVLCIVAACLALYGAAL